jgi:hypothetical protein
VADANRRAAESARLKEEIDAVLGRQVDRPPDNTLFEQGERDMYQASQDSLEDPNSRSNSPNNHPYDPNATANLGLFEQSLLDDSYHQPAVSSAQAASRPLNPPRRGLNDSGIAASGRRPVSNDDDVTDGVAAVGKEPPLSRSRAEQQAEIAELVTEVRQLLNATRAQQAGLRSHGIGDKDDSDDNDDGFDNGNQAFEQVQLRGLESKLNAQMRSILVSLPV